MFYVWNGRGARPDEKKAAFDYATSLCSDADSVTVLEEGENDEDEIFWAVLGDSDRDYAKASYWVWRASVNLGDPQLWKITASSSQQVDPIYRVAGERLTYPSSRTSPPQPTRPSKMVSLSWTLFQRCLFSSALRLGVNGKIFDWPLRLRR